MPRSRGFTLVELMIVLAILGIILGLAVPAMGDFLVRQRVKSQANEIMLAVVVARSEASKLNDSVSVVPDGNWSNGWCVVVTSGGTACNGNNLVQRFNSRSDVTITSNFGTTNASRLEFNRYGACPNCDLAGGLDARFITVTSPRLNATSPDARCVRVSRQGRPTVSSITRDESC